MYDYIHQFCSNYCNSHISIRYEMSRLIIESGIDPFTDSPTGVGFTDLECGKFRVYNSDTVNFQAYGSIDEKKGYVTADLVQIVIPPPPLTPPVNLNRPYYYLAGLATPGNSDIIYPPNAMILLNNGGTITSNNGVIINDINGDGSELEVMTPGTYHILIHIATIGNNVVGITLDGILVPQSTSKADADLDCIVQIPVGGRISLVNIGNVALTVRASSTPAVYRLYSTVLFELYTTP